VRHWNRHLRTERNASARARMRRSRIINAIGGVICGMVLVVVLITKFIHGAGYAVAAMAFLYWVMTKIHNHYERVSAELAVSEAEADHNRLPSRVHAIVLISKLHKPALRALSYARATRPNRLEAITVDVDPAETAALQRDWDARGIPVPLTALDSPYREIIRPIVEHIKSLRSDNPRDVVVVYVPEYVVGRWWEQILHNQSALRLKTRLRFMPGVMVASVPWQLRSSAGQEPVLSGPAPGDVRRGE